MNFDSLADFRLVALHGGFGRASRAGGRPKSTLSKHVMQLESELGVRLLDRTGRDVHLTEEGEKVNQFAARLLLDMDDFRDAMMASRGQPVGRLKVAAPSLFSFLWMGGLVAAFTERYEAVHVEVDISDNPTDRSTEFVDVVIRVNPPPDLDLIGKVFARDRARIVASRAQLDKLQTRGGIADGAHVASIAPTGVYQLGPWQAQLGGKDIRLLPDIAMSLPSRVTIRDAVCAGFGFAELPLSLIHRDLESGQLVDLGPAPSPDVELWALYTSRRLLSPRVTAFLRFLDEYFRSTIISPV